jgi:hypothetical protein
MLNLVRIAIRGCYVSAGCMVLIHQSVAQTSCNESIGRENARRLVEQCLIVSPATHPPCNGSNPCPLIEDEVRRGCMLLDKNVPAFCAPYRHRG